MTKEKQSVGDVRRNGFNPSRTYAIPMYRCTLVKERTTIRLPNEYAKLGTFEQVAKALHYLTDDSPTELMVLFFLDGNNNLVGAEIIAKGGMHGCAVRCCDVLRSALISGASAFVVGHNHPSGNPSPSSEDIVMTVNLTDAAESVAMPFLDHVVVSRGKPAESVFTVMKGRNQ